MAYNMKRGNSAVPFKELGSSPAKHGDHGSSEKKTLEKHKAFHTKYGFKAVKKDDKGTTTTHTDYIPEERDFSKHNVAARKTEGTIEEQEAKRKPNKPK